MITHRIKKGESRTLVMAIVDHREMMDVPPPKNRKYKGHGEDAPWTFGELGNEKALRDSIEGGRPTDKVWSIYRKLRETFVPDEDGDRVICIRRRCRLDDSGDEVNVDRYLSGDCRHWGTYRRLGKKLAVTIGIQFSLSCGNADKDYAENIASAVILADAMIQAGYMVRIVGLHSVYQEKHESGLLHPVAEYGEPIDEARLLAYGTPGWQRYFGFIQRGEFLLGIDGIDDIHGNCLSTSPELLALAGIDILVAKQWATDKNGKATTDHAQYVANLMSQARKVVGSAA